MNSANRVNSALERYRAGGLVIVTDDESRENEGDLIVRADLVTVEQTAFIIRHTTGILCVAMSEASANALVYRECLSGIKINEELLSPFL